MEGGYGEMLAYVCSLCGYRVCMHMYMLGEEKTEESRLVRMLGQ